MALKELDPTLVTVGQPVEGGCCYVSFNGKGAVPEDANTKMSNREYFESAGEISENGFTETTSVSTTTHKGWHGTTLLITNDEVVNTFKIEFTEVNRGTAAKLRYGSTNVVVDDEGAVTKIDNSGINNDTVSIVIDELESNGYLRRTVVKRAMVSNFDDVAHASGTLMVYGMEFTALEPVDGSPAVVIYRAKPAGSAEKPIANKAVASA